MPAHICRDTNSMDSWAQATPWSDSDILWHFWPRAALPGLVDDHKTIGLPKMAKDPEQQRFHHRNRDRRLFGYSSGGCRVQGGGIRFFPSLCCLEALGS